MTFDPDKYPGYILIRLDNFLMQNPALNLEEKLYLSIIFGFTIQGKCCFASTDWIAYKLGLSPLLVFEMEKKLARQGFIKIRQASYRDGARAVTFILDGFEDPCEGDQFDEHLDIFSVDADEIEPTED
jgi:hypothetical protein